MTECVKRFLSNIHNSFWYINNRHFCNFITVFRGSEIVHVFRNFGTCYFVYSQKLFWIFEIVNL